MYTPERIFVNIVVELVRNEYGYEDAIREAMPLVGMTLNESRNGYHALASAQRDVKIELINILSEEYLDEDYFDEATERLKIITECLDVMGELML